MSKPQSRADPNRYITQSKSPQIYEPVLKSKEEKSFKPQNGGNTYSTNTKPPQNIPSKSQDEIDAFELAQAQKSLRLLKSKMSVTPKQIINQRNEEDIDEPKTFQKFNNKFNQEAEENQKAIPKFSNNNRFAQKTEPNINEETGGENKNYRKVFKPALNNDKKEEISQNKEPNYIKMTKNTTSTTSGGINREEFKANSPISQPSNIRKPYEQKSALEEIQNDDFFANKKAVPKYQNKPMETSTKNPLSSKNNNMKPTAEDYEYYNKNTRHYSNYMYQENATETTQDNRNIKAPAQMASNNIQKGSTPTLSSNNNKTYNNPTTSNSNAISNSNNRANNNPTTSNAGNNNMKPNAYNNVASNPTTNNGKPQNNAYNKNKYYQEEEEPEEEHNEEDEDQEQEDNEQNDENENENNDDDEGNDAKAGGGNNLNEYGEPGEMVQCTMGCGRKFNANAIKKHMKICKKVFQAKRKVFDSSKARTKDVVPDKLIGKTKGKTTSQQTAKNGANKEKWKKQSEGFRAMLKEGKGGAISAEEKQELKNAMEEAQGLVPCNFCGRKFNEVAAQKHIPFCENKHRMDKLKQQPGKKR